MGLLDNLVSEAIVGRVVLDGLVDRTGALWIAYTDGDGTWVERRQ